MSVHGAAERIAAEVTAWPGVEAEVGEPRVRTFTFRGRELGHLHGDGVAHFGFSREVGSELREAGRVGPHPVAPHSVKLAARRVATDADVKDVIALLRLNYQALVARLGRVDEAGEAGGNGVGVDAGARRTAIEGGVTEGER
jgi:hypothetical protein